MTLLIIFKQKAHLVVIIPTLKLLISRTSSGQAQAKLQIVLYLLNQILSAHIYNEFSNVSKIN